MDERPDRRSLHGLLSEDFNAQHEALEMAVVTTNADEDQNPGDHSDSQVNSSDVPEMIEISRRNNIPVTIEGLQDQIKMMQEKIILLETEKSELEYAALERSDECETIHHLSHRLAWLKKTFTICFKKIEITLDLACFVNILL